MSSSEKWLPSTRQAQVAGNPSSCKHLEVLCKSSTSLGVQLSLRGEETLQVREMKDTRDIRITRAPVTVVGDRWGQMEREHSGS